MSPRIALHRRVICQRCPAPCELYLKSEIAHADPSVWCPDRRWDVFYGDGGATLPVAPVLLPIQGSAAKWEELHRRYLRWDGSDDTEWLMKDFTARVLITGCGCLPHWMKLLQDHPPRWHDAFTWSVEVHNLTSQRIEREKGLKRPFMTVEQALQRWSNPA